MDRINALTQRLEALAALQPAPDLVLILDDGSKQNVFGTLPEALAGLQLPPLCGVSRKARQHG